MTQQDLRKKRRNTFVDGSREIPLHVCINEETKERKNYSRPVQTGQPRTRHAGQTQHFQSASSEAWRNDARGDNASLVASVGSHLSMSHLGGIGRRPCLHLVCSDALTCGDEASHGFVIRR
jgi:hypothetical protein